MAHTGTMPASKASFTARAWAVLPLSPRSAAPGALAVPKDIDITSMPLLESLLPQLVSRLLIAHSIPLMTSALFALPTSVNTFRSTRYAPGAMPVYCRRASPVPIAIPDTCVPWPAVSSGSSLPSTFEVSDVAS